MNEKGSITVEAAIIFPVIFFFISACITLTIITYNRNARKIADRNKKYDVGMRKPAEVIRNSEYILELVDKAGDLFDIFR